jgi:YjbE family integral membrane protein
VEFGSPQFWIAVLQIIAIDILLGGDNAVVIALACRNLPAKQRKLGIFWGVFGAIALRVVITIFAVTLLAIPFLKIIGAILLMWIGLKLVMPQEGEGEHNIDASASLMGAIKTIIVADFVMSLDNVIAVAAAAKDSTALIVFGLVVSVPIIVWCSTFILKMMERYPVIIVLGGGLLGYIAGDMFVRDPVLKDWMDANLAWLRDYHIAGIIGAVLVITVGKTLAMRAARAQAAHGVIDLATDDKKS